MTAITFPTELEDLLDQSPYEAAIRALADQVGTILKANKTAFFPDYTDHGVEHVQAVLNSAVELIPKAVWEENATNDPPRLLTNADAAVLIGGVLLHDLAMHLTKPGFLELIRPDCRFKPLDWFKESHEGHEADRPWHELWADYEREARRFSDRQLTDIIGEEAARVWKFDGLPPEAEGWSEHVYRIIGEFLRRHHARLAHEIAIYGFPGVPVGSGEHQFPAMGTAPGHPLKDLADLIGLVARSHGMNLRPCLAYLDQHPLHSGTLRPMDAAVLYSMALLRLADYLEIDQSRAPAVLLQLRQPQSPVSVREWAKHAAVRKIVPSKDVRAKQITVAKDLPLSMYLQLRDLVDGLQREIDHSTAVLGEVYGRLTQERMDRLGLSICRVHSNLNDPNFRRTLPYVPERTGFSSDPRLLKLLVGPLYGEDPAIGVRELMQNANDAVRERRAWNEKGRQSTGDLDSPGADGHVLIEFEKNEAGSWLLRVRDRGIGMTDKTIQNYFLRAGASLRLSEEWNREYVDDEGRPRVLRTGRFGIGVFAVFLLGRSFKVRTRHVTAGPDGGLSIDAAESREGVEIRREQGFEIGTTIEVELDAKAASLAETMLKATGPDSPPASLPGRSELPGWQIDWYCGDWPKVVKRLVTGDERRELPQRWSVPLDLQESQPEVSALDLPSGERVIWTFVDRAPGPTISSMPFTCNGFCLTPRAHSGYHGRPGWSESLELHPPVVGLLDGGSKPVLNLQRSALADSHPVFVRALERDVVLSFIAHALVCGPTSRAAAIDERRPRHPQCILEQDRKWLQSYRNVQGFTSNHLRWCATSTHAVPTDPWLFRLLKAPRIYVIGVVRREVTRNPYPTILGVDLTGIVRGASLQNEDALIFWPLDFDGQQGRYHVSQSAAPLAFNTATLPGLGVQNVGSSVWVDHAPSRNLPEPLDPRLRGAGDYGVGKAYETIDLTGLRDVSWRRSRFGNPVDDSALLPLMTALVETFKPPAEASQGPNSPLFAAVVHPKYMGCPAASLLAKVWNEFLGPRAIPFAPQARQALIDDGLKHPELARHIKPWQRMKADGSKWVTGG